MPDMAHIVRNDVSLFELFNEEQEKEFWQDFRGWLLNPGYEEWFADIPMTAYILWIIPYLTKVERLVLTQYHMELHEIYSGDHDNADGNRTHIPFRRGSKLGLSSSVYKFFEELPQVDCGNASISMSNDDRSSFSLRDIRYELGSYSSSPEKQSVGRHSSASDMDQKLVLDDYSVKISPRRTLDMDSFYAIDSSNDFYASKKRNRSTRLKSVPPKQTKENDECNFYL
jgi:hypothetical protein